MPTRAQVETRFRKAARGRRAGLARLFVLFSAVRADRRECARFCFIKAVHDGTVYHARFLQRSIVAATFGRATRVRFP